LVGSFFGALPIPVPLRAKATALRRKPQRV
jgi:hypothetical protein